MTDNLPLQNNDRIKSSSEQLTILPNGSNSATNSHHLNPNSDRLSSQQLGQALQPLIKAIARLEKKQEEIRTELANNRALLQELKQTCQKLKTAEEAPSLPTTDEVEKSVMSSMDMSQEIALRQELASRQSLRPAELMNQFLESKLKQRERSLRLVLNGKELSWTKAIVIVGAIWLLSVPIGLLVLLGFASPLLERITVLQQIEERGER